MDGGAVSFVLSGERGLLLEARRGRRVPNGFLATGVLLLVILLGFGLVAIGAVILAGGEEGAADRLFDSAYGYTIPFALCVLFLAAWVALYERRSPLTLGLAPKRFARRLLGGMAVALLMTFVTVGVMALAGCVSIDPSAGRPAGTGALGSVLFMLAVFLVQGGSEEILLRGWYLPVLGARHRPWIAVLISSVVFAGMHAPARPVAIVNLLLFGLFTAVYSLREGSVWGVCGWHAAWNWAYGNLLGMGVSGHEIFGGTLLNLKEEGPSVLSGGDYGPEGSLIATVVLLAGIALVLTRRRKPDST